MASIVEATLAITRVVVVEREEEDIVVVVVEKKKRESKERELEELYKFRNSRI